MLGTGDVFAVSYDWFIEQFVFVVIVKSNCFGFGCATLKLRSALYNKFMLQQAPPEGSPTGGLCPKGGYCPQGAKTPEPCPVGKYSGTKGNKEPDDCITCDPGYVYCQ